MGRGEHFGAYAMNAHLLAGAVGSWLHDVWFRPSNSTHAADADGKLIFAGVDWVFMFILWVSIVSFLIIVVPMCWWAWKYRRRPGVPAQRTPNHNTVLEITWIVLPLIILVFIFFWGFHGYMSTQVHRADALTINVSGKKWSWTPVYPNGANSGESKFFDDRTKMAAAAASSTGAGNDQASQRGNQGVPVLIVPVGQPVRFLLKSDDVIHSFFIPDARVKMDVFPNRYTSYTFTPVKETKQVNGVYQDHPIYCAEYCGTNHSEMGAFLRVLSVAEYERVIAEWGDILGKGHKEGWPLWQIGKFVFDTRGCSGCHTVDGSKSSGPSWKGSYGKPVPLSTSRGLAIDFSTEEGWANYIRESIIDPSAKIHQGFEAVTMTSYAGQITETHILGVIEYFKHLNGVASTIKVPDPKDPANPDRLAK